MAVHRTPTNAPAPDLQTEDQAAETFRDESTEARDTAIVEGYGYEDETGSTEPAAPGVGDLVVTRDGEGNPARIGIIVGEGREPNPDRTDAQGRACPESPEPLIAWFLTEVPSPYGGPIDSLS